MNHTPPLHYLNGLGNYFESSVVPDVLQPGRHSPQKVAYGLYTEQLSGSAFTSPRHHNLHTWLYRIRPSVLHGEFVLKKHDTFTRPPDHLTLTPPTQLRWDPMPYPSVPLHFVDSLVTLAGNGSIAEQTGAAIHLYCANRSMQEEYFYNADGDFLIVPQEGVLHFKTEFGLLDVGPGELVLLPRGVKFQVQLREDKARGYVCENFGMPFRLPELGVIGANGLAHARDFQMPVAWFEDQKGPCQLLAKFQGGLWEAEMGHSPLDVAAWHGNYLPYKYDLNLFNTINTVSVDHPDPSIFTVLTSPSAYPGIANVDFVIFPPRWMVADKTFRPPYFHRNIMSEYMGLIKGTYDAKETGFIPGGGSLHNCMSAHGPDENAYHQAISKSLSPEYLASTLAFMFESRQVWRLTEKALFADFRQKDYLQCWQGLNANFQTSFTTA